MKTGMIGIGALVCWACVGTSQPKPLETEDIPTLIKQLGSRSFRAREEARKTLRNRPEAIPALRQALRSSDREVVAAAKLLLDHLVNRKTRKREAWLREVFSEGTVDWVADYCSEMSDPEDKVVWRGLVLFNNRLLLWEKKQYGKTTMSIDDTTPVETLEGFVKRMKPRVFRATKPIKDGHSCLVSGERISFYTTVRSLAIASELVRSEGIGVSLVYSGGDVEVDGLGKAVVVCAGDVIVNLKAKDSLIIAQGDVRFKKPTQVEDCRIIAGGKVHLSDYGKRPEVNSVTENHKGSFGIVRFFRLSDVGLKITEEEDALRVAELDKEGTLAEAGLREGDAILAVEGKESASSKVLTRQVRKGMVKDLFTLKVRRNATEREITVRPFGY